MSKGPTPFEVYESGEYLHGTKADLQPGDLLAPGQLSNYDADRTLHHLYFTQTLDAAAWGAELAHGDGAERIYMVEPIGDVEDDPNVTDKRFPGNPTRSYRTREAVRIVRELEEWNGHAPEQIRAMREALAKLRDSGEDVVLD